MRPSLFPLCLSCLLPMAAMAAPPRYVQLVNHADDSIVSMQVAPHASTSFTEVPLEERLHGGGESQTVALRREGCRYDLRFGFADGRTLRYEDVDLCRYGKVGVRALPRDAAGDAFVVRWDGAKAAEPVAVVEAESDR